MIAPDDKWITVRNAAEILGVSKQRVFCLINEGKIGCIKISPRLCKVRLKDVLGYKKFRDSYLELIQSKLTISTSKPKEKLSEEQDLTSSMDGAQESLNGKNQEF
jgi:excisionase family DNA binding protein